MAITKEEKEARKSGLFSSDIARIMTGHSVEVALQKLGYLDNKDDAEDEEDEKQEYKIGKLAEPLILDAYDSMMGCKVERNIGTIMHPEISWMGCHQDARIPQRNVEAKTVRREMRHNWGNGDDKVDNYVLWQAVVQMAVSNTMITDIPVCFLHLNNVRYLLAQEPPQITLFQIKRDYELEDYMIKKATHVRECIEQGITPEPENLSDIKLLYPVALEPAIEATPEVVTYYQNLLMVKEELSKWEEKEKDYKLKIQSFMKAHDALILVDDLRRILATWKNDRDGVKFNLKKFEVDHPDLYKQYLEDKPGARKLLPKKLK